MSEKGIKELLEALDAVRVIAVTGAAIAEDGLEVEDIQDLIDGVKKLDVLKAGWEGKEDIVLEAKDLDGVEVGLVVSRLVKLVNDTRKAYKGEEVEL